MNDTTTNQPYLEQALAEHRQIHEQVHHLRQQLRTVPRDVGSDDLQRVLGELDVLRARLHGHFAQEEEGGYLDEAISRAPRFAHQAAGLQKQHAQFVKAVDQMITQGQQAEPSNAAWLQLSEAFDRFADKLETHELAENEILGSAFNVAV